MALFRVTLSRALQASRLSKSAYYGTMPSPKPIRILLSGATETVGASVIELSKPDIEVVHFILAASAHTEIPLLLCNEVPPTLSSALGTGDWASGAPVALVLGGAYHDADVEALRSAVAGRLEARRIPWLRVDASRPHPAPPKYAAAIAERMKTALKELEREGRLGDGQEGVVFF